MNILYLTNHLNAGGITSYLLTQARGMRGYGHNVFIASSGGDMESAFEKEGVHLFKVNLKTKSELSPKVYTALFKIKKYAEQNDIDVVHASTRITQVIAYWLTKNTRRVFVSTCHGYFKRRLGRRLFPCWGEEVLAISSQVLDHLKNDFKVKADKIKLVESGIDVKSFAQKDDYKVDKLRERFNPQRKKIVGLVARLSDVKGQDILVHAFKEVLNKRDDVICLLVGEGKLEGMLKELISSLNIEEDVLIIPVVNETRDFLHLFDVSVMPSRQEGLGLSIIEAQASSCPVVASRVGGIPTLIDHEITGLLAEPENPKDFADKIIQMLDSDELRNRMVEQALANVKEKFDATSMVGETLAVYERLIKRKILN